MARLFKNLRKPGWKFCLNGIGTRDGLSHVLAQNLRDGGLKYEGQWLNGVMQGSGVFDWSDGRLYRGDWMGGKSNGLGVQHWTSGQRYEGEYKASSRHGMCVEFYAYGSKFQGEYRNDKRVTGVFTNSNGDTELRKYDTDGKEDESARISGVDLLMRVMGMPVYA